MSKIKFEIVHHLRHNGKAIREVVFRSGYASDAYHRALTFETTFVQTPDHHHEYFYGAEKLSFKGLEAYHVSRKNEQRQSDERIKNGSTSGDGSGSSGRGIGEEIRADREARKEEAREEARAAHSYSAGPVGFDGRDVVHD